MCDKIKIKRKPEGYIEIIIWNMKSRTKHSSLNSPPSLPGGTDSAKTHYPSISSAYWLPAPNPTPYIIPG
jgi:hypothetical protein